MNSPLSLKLLDAPIFVIIGAGRSGTTYFFDLLSKHPDFGFFTNFDDILCHTPLFGMTRRFFETNYWQKLGRRKNWASLNDYSTLWPRKTEAYRFWRRYAGEHFTRGYLWHERPDQKTVATIRRKVAKLTQRQRRSLFTAKLTGPGRIGYLRAIFPGARFIHLVRDARAQVYSTLNVGFWNAGGGNSKLWWSHDLPDTYAEYLREAEASGEPLALAAAQWRSVVNSIRDEATRLLAPDAYRELCYEELVQNPVSTIIGLWSWLGLELIPGAMSELDSLKVRSDANKQWETGLSPEQQTILSNWLELPL